MRSSEFEEFILNQFNKLRNEDEHSAIALQSCHEFARSLLEGSGLETDDEHCRAFLKPFDKDNDECLSLVEFTSMMHFIYSLSLDETVTCIKSEVKGDSVLKDEKFVTMLKKVDTDPFVASTYDPEQRALPTHEVVADLTHELISEVNAVEPTGEHAVFMKSSEFEEFVLNQYNKLRNEDEHSAIALQSCYEFARSLLEGPGLETDDEHCRAFLKPFDKDNDECLTLEEFTDLMRFIYSLSLH